MVQMEKRKKAKVSKSLNSGCHSAEMKRDLYLSTGEQRGRGAGHLGEFTVDAIEASSFEWHVC